MKLGLKTLNKQQEVETICCATRNDFVQWHVLVWFSSVMTFLSSWFSRKAKTPSKTLLHQSLCTKPSENRQTLSSGCPGTELVGHGGSKSGNRVIFAWTLQRNWDYWIPLVSTQLVGGILMFDDHIQGLQICFEHRSKQLPAIKIVPDPYDRNMKQRWENTWIHLVSRNISIPKSCIQSSLRLDKDFSFST